jgi:hypothetical protein
MNLLYDSNIHDCKNSNSEVKKQTLSLILHEFLLSQDNQTGGGSEEASENEDSNVAWIINLS